MVAPGDFHRVGIVWRSEVDAAVVLEKYLLGPGVLASRMGPAKTMQKLEFAEAVELVTAKHPLYDREAYFFLKDALDYTVSLHKKSRAVGGCHVSGQQLLEGVREFALKQFGPMVVTVFDYWNVRACEDFGRMVFHLIEVGVFGKSDKDSVEDFKGGYSFHEAFVRPFLPNFEKLVSGRVRRREPTRGRAQKSAKTSPTE